MMLPLPLVRPPGAYSLLFSVGTNGKDEAATAANSNWNSSATPSSDDKPCDVYGTEEIKGDEDPMTTKPSSNKRTRDGEGDDEEALLLLSSLGQKHPNTITNPSANKMVACKKQVAIEFDHAVQIAVKIAMEKMVDMVKTVLKDQAAAHVMERETLHPLLKEKTDKIERLIQERAKMRHDLDHT